ncbi:MAG: DUF4402 domain-containing protein [Pseudomonadota bacterium]|nr:DUF4402 domain-containing protein [Pseudomonadota bacterium]
MNSALASRDCRCRWLVALLLALWVCPAVAAEITIVPTQDLAFGSFVAGTGSVTMLPGGARSTSGGVIGLSSDGGTAAQFSVSGDPGATFAITLPANGTVFLSNGSSNMPVNGFVSSPSSGGTFLSTQVISVGATLDVAEGQPTGAYSGTFLVIVDYN